MPESRAILPWMHAQVICIADHIHSHQVLHKENTLDIVPIALRKLEIGGAKRCDVTYLEDIPPIQVIQTPVPWYMLMYKEDSYFFCP